MFLKYWFFSLVLLETSTLVDQDQRQEAKEHGPIRTGCMYVLSDNAKDNITVDNTRQRLWKFELSWNCNKQAVRCMTIETIWFQSFQST